MKFFFNSIRGGGTVFLIKLAGTSSYNGLTKSKRLLNQIVKWEQITQKNYCCYDCQRVGHIVGYCTLKYRCVKCELDRKLGECTVGLNEVISRENLYCINCKKKLTQPHIEGVLNYLKKKSSISGIISKQLVTKK